MSAYSETAEIIADGITDCRAEAGLPRCGPLTPAEVAGIIDGLCAGGGPVDIDVVVSEVEHLLAEDEAEDEDERLCGGAR